MQIKIKSNGFDNLILDTTTGMVSGVPENIDRVEIGYLHLDPDVEYSKQEQVELTRINILSFAEQFSPWSEKRMKASEQFKRAWEPGEKEVKINKILSAKIAPGLDAVLFGAYNSEEDRNTAIAKVQREKYVTENRKTYTQRLGFGGSFQRFSGEGWIEEAEKLKGSKILMN